MHIRLAIGNVTSLPHGDGIGGRGWMQMVGGGGGGLAKHVGEERVQRLFRINELTCWSLWF